MNFVGLREQSVQGLREGLSSRSQYVHVLKLSDRSLFDLRHNVYVRNSKSVKLSNLSPMAISIARVTKRKEKPDG